MAWAVTLWLSPYRFQGGGGGSMFTKVCCWLDVKVPPDLIMLRVCMYAVLQECNYISCVRGSGIAV